MLKLLHTFSRRDEFVPGIPLVDPKYVEVSQFSTFSGAK